MTVTQTENLLVCIPDAIPNEHRSAHFVLAKSLLTEAAVRTEVLPNGYAFEFPAGEFESVARFVMNERKCCPFMRFDVSVAPNSGAVELRMTGPAGTRELIEAELGIASCGSKSCGCAK